MKRRRPNGAPESPVRSVRIDNVLWDKARSRAEEEGVTMSEVLAAFTRGYADRHINMPQVHVVYEEPLV